MDFNNPDPAWAYKYSDNLKQNIAFEKASGWIVCEDGTRYSPEENEILKKAKQSIPLQVHLVKKLFNGTIVPPVTL